MSERERKEGTKTKGITYKFVDLFACGGGATMGAKCVKFAKNILKGPRSYMPVLAVDYDTDALAVHAANHPTCAHLCVELGTPHSAELVKKHHAFPKMGEPWHLHMSPPCNKLCQMNKAAHGESTEGREAMDEEGMRLVNWSLGFLLETEPTTWSFENVKNSKLLEELAKLREAHPELIDFGVFKFSEYGLPSERERVLAGTPALIQRFRALPRRICTLEMAFKHEAWDLPSKFVSGSGRTNNREVVAASPTVTNYGLTFTNRRNEKIRTMEPHELGRMQSFPASYDWQLGHKPTFHVPSHKAMLSSRGKAIATIGNAFPPLVAALLLGATYDGAERAGLLTPAANRVTSACTGKGDAGNTEEDADTELLARPPGGGLYVTVDGRGRVKCLTSDMAERNTSLCVHHVGGGAQSCTLTAERIASVKRLHAQSFGAGGKKRCAHHVKKWRKTCVAATAESMTVVKKKKMMMTTPKKKKKKTCTLSIGDDKKKKTGFRFFLNVKF